MKRKTKLTETLLSTIQKRVKTLRRKIKSSSCQLYHSQTTNSLHFCTKNVNSIFSHTLRTKKSLKKISKSSDQFGIDNSKTRGSENRILRVISFRLYKKRPKSYLLQTKHLEPLKHKLQRVNSKVSLQGNCWHCGQKSSSFILFLAKMTQRDAIIQKVRDCILFNDEKSCKNLSKRRELMTINGRNKKKLNSQTIPQCKFWNYYKAKRKRLNFSCKDSSTGRNN